MVVEVTRGFVTVMSLTDLQELHSTKDVMNWSPNRNVIKYLTRYGCKMNQFWSILSKCGQTIYQIPDQCLIDQIRFIFDNDVKDL